jgi:hypothetical protein
MRPIPCCWSVGTRPHRAVNSAGWTASPDPVAAGRSGHASIGGEFCRLGCVSDTASTAPKLGGDQPLRQIGF